MSNKELIILLKKRSTLAYEFIYKSYYADLLNFAYSYLMNRELAEDFVHDIYHKIWEDTSMLDGVNNIKMYLFTSIKNRCLNHFKHLGIVDNNMDKVVESVIFSSTYSYIEDNELAENVSKYIDRLPAAQQLVIKMRFIEGKSYNNIADELGISTETVHTHMKRAFKFFRENYRFITVLPL